MSSIASAGEANVRVGSGYYDLGDVNSIEDSQVFAKDYGQAKENLHTLGVVAYYPVKSTNTVELDLYHNNLDGMARLMTRMKEQLPDSGNRGKARHCLNSFNDSLFDDDSYELLHQLLRPGRMALHLLEELYPGSSYDTGIGDLVEAHAPSGNAATQWHQDWQLKGHVLCLSVFTHDIGDNCAPMMIGFGNTVIKCTGGKGLVIIRDVAVWHKGSQHTGNVDRIMPSYRFTTPAAQALGYGIRKSLNYNTAAKFPPIIRGVLEKRTRAETPFGKPRWSSDHDKADSIETPVMASPWGIDVCFAGIRLLPCLCFSEVKKFDKKAADENRPSMTVRFM